MTKKPLAFVATVRKFYTNQGRHDLPWRQTHDPYQILVSEVMLQQTQVARVITKYAEFLKAYPTVQSLAKAPLGAVLTVWQGLGYNRRAKLLQMCAQTIVRDYGGVWPSDVATLRALPGVGPYTAGAVAAFAFAVPSTIIETNIRSVYIYHFFPNETEVPDTKLLPIITATLDTDNPRDWYYALMDYGSHVKQTLGNKSRQSKHYQKQSKFVGSDRQIRGAVIRTLSQTNDGLTMLQLTQSNLTLESDRFQVQLDTLIKERMITKKGRLYKLTD